MENEIITAWVTKYALTKGILEVSGEVCHASSAGNHLRWGHYFGAHGKNWHRTREAAVTRAEAMRAAKLASLRKSIAQMESLNFAVVKTQDVLPKSNLTAEQNHGYVPGACAAKVRARGFKSLIRHQSTQKQNEKS